MLIYYLLILIIPLEHHPYWSSYLGDFTMVKYVGGAAAIYALIHLFLRSRPLELTATGASRWFLAFMAIAAIQYFRTGSFEDVARSPLLKCVSLLLMCWTTLVVVDRPSRLRWTLLCLVGAVAFASLYVLRDWQKYHTVYDGYRGSGAAGDPNYFGMSATITLPLALYLAFERHSKVQKWFCLVSLVVTSFAVAVGGSRGALLGLAGVCLLVMLRSRQRFRYLVLSGALIIPPLLLFNNSPVRRLLAPTERDRLNGQARTIVWAAGMRMIQAEPLWGIGLGRFKPMATRFERQDQDPVESIAHNTYIEIAAEMGVPTLALYLALYASVICLLERIHRLGKRTLIGRAALALEAGVVGMTACAVFLSVHFEKMPWIVVFIALAMAPIAERSRRRRLRRRSLKRDSVFHETMTRRVVAQP